MKKETTKIEFEVISYNLLATNDEIPTEMRVVFDKNVDIYANFLSVVEDIVQGFNLSDSLDKGTNFYLANIYEELWSEFFEREFLKEMLNDIDKYNYSKFDVTIKELNDQFNLSNKRIKIVIPCNGDNGKMYFFFHIDKANTKPRPHIHCKYCNIETMIDLNKVEFINDGFHSTTISELALNTIRRHQQELINYFDKIKQEGEKVKFVMTI